MSDHGAFLEAALAEFRRLKALAEKAMAQVDDDQALHVRLDQESNSLAVIVRHVAGNMVSRWTDFLTTDGEKPDRNRDGEFEERPAQGRADLMAEWERGWRCTFDAVEALHEHDLGRTVHIRAQPLTVLEAVNRQVSHYAYHVGQIVFLSRHLAAGHWTSLTIPRGRSAEFGSQGRR